MRRSRKSSKRSRPGLSVSACKKMDKGWSWVILAGMRFCGFFFLQSILSRHLKVTGMGGVDQVAC